MCQQSRSIQIHYDHKNMFPLSSPLNIESPSASQVTLTTLSAWAGYTALFPLARSQKQTDPLSRPRDIMWEDDSKLKSQITLGLYCPAQISVLSLRRSHNLISQSYFSVVAKTWP